MATAARSYFAGVATTFVILAIGFGGGIMLATKATNASTGASVESAKVRVIFPVSAEPAIQLKEKDPSESPATIQSTLCVQPNPPLQEKVVEQKVSEAAAKFERRKAKDSRRTRAERKRYAERRARRIIERDRSIESEPPILAFGGNNGNTNFFGN